MDPASIVLPDGRQVVLIHFVAGGRIACMPNMLAKDMSSNRERVHPHMRSDAASAVTCPMCKATKVWEAAPK